MPLTPHPAATEHVPFFVTALGSTDVLMVAMGIFLFAAILGAGVFFFWLHSLPERMVHNKIQFDIVAVLALLSLFTHIHAFWVAALLIALIDIPEFSFPHISKTLGSMAGSLEKIATATPGTNSTPAAERPPDISSNQAAPSGT